VLAIIYFASSTNQLADMFIIKSLKGSCVEICNKLDLYDICSALRIVKDMISKDKTYRSWLSLGQRKESHVWGIFTSFVNFHDQLVNMLCTKLSRGPHINYMSNKRSAYMTYIFQLEKECYNLLDNRYVRIL